MAALYNLSLTVYPFYQTSKLVIQLSDSDTSVDDANSGAVAPENVQRALLQMMYFWVTFGAFKVFESFGADGLPLFTTLEALLLMSMYTQEYSNLVSNVYPRVCSLYITNADKIVTYAQTTLVGPTVAKAQQSSWYGKVTSSLSGITSMFFGGDGGGAPGASATKTKKE